MATTGQHNKTINKNDSGFPEYLDFEKLRAEGIAYLGKLSGKIWTDHNVHDPGITILEVLCYAILDLGYRTNLPSIDLFTNNPAETSGDDNFFSPAQILSCNPLSIIDYRKFLIDIDGVKNAWISVATDQKDLCKSRSNQFSVAAQQNYCEEYLNGLYHVYIETEKNATSDFVDSLSAISYISNLKEKVKQRLMAKRNFCEDFVDINILNKLKIGVCASVELNPDADPETTYTSMVQRLRDFLSPSPQFYTLQQLLDKGKPIEEIFAGRAYNLNESHGFIDTAELLQIKLKKEIHLSDVYHVMLSTDGVKAVTNLVLKNCDEGNLNTDIDWKFKLPENHVVDFSIECSGFQFSKNGMPLEFDTRKYEGLFNINFSHNGKVLYQSPSAYLDSAVPKGIYHDDLDDYYLLQNDFPKVYGITEGGLPKDVSDHRKAQALQLKAYLLFFDQLLAGYLAQLKNIRALFAMSASQDKAKQRTYFLNKLEDMPELTKLLRFAVGSDESNNLGAEGSILVRVVAKTKLNDLILLDQSKEVDPNALESYKFNTLINQQIAINGLIEDFVAKTFEFGFLNENGNTIYYYLTSSSDDFALISNIGFRSIASANLHLNSVTYIGSFEENYRTFIIDENNVSFDLELNISSFKSYLALIVEDQELYGERRNTFLDHLLSRFAEKFTDQALFAFANHSRNDDSTALIKAKENFLSNYDEISANRGKAYDYLENSWSNNNVSGFENEAKYLSGIDNKGRYSLCNFVVIQYDEQYIVELKIAEDSFFTLSEKFDSAADAEEAAQAVFNSLSEPDKLSTRYVVHDKMYSIQLQYNDRQSVPFFKQYATSQEADAVRNSLNRMFSKVPTEDVYISRYTYKAQLLDGEGNVVRSSIASFNTETEAREMGIKLATKVNDNKKWLAEGLGESKIAELYSVNNNADNQKFIDVKAFKININNTIVGKPDQFTYDLLDSENSFKFYAAKEFDTNKEAKQHAYFVLSLATDPHNYKIERRSIDSNFMLNIFNEDQLEASCYTEFETVEEAERMRNQMTESLRKAEYILRTISIPTGWKFNYSLGYDPSANYQFSSAHEYTLEEEAVKAAQAFHKAIPTLQFEHNKKGGVLAQLKKSTKIPSLNLIAEASVQPPDEAIAKALAEQKNIVQYATSKKLQIFKTAVRVDETGDNGKYVYRLVDKDRVLAFYQESYENRDAANLGRMKVAKMLKQGEFLSELTRSYPIKSVEYGSEEFNRLFCANIDPSTTDVCRTGKPRKQVYYFATYNNEKDPQHWQSIKYYDSAEAAMQDFNFFTLLLKYSGNLYVDCDTCENTGGTYRIFIREVLAESTQRFYDEETAWGKEGVQKFICAVQSELGFHKYQRKEDCCYTFYLNCGPDIFVHPCVYDTAKKRNKVLIDLYEQHNVATEKGSYSVHAENDFLVLMDESGSPFAKKNIGKSQNQDSCDFLMDMIADIQKEDNIYLDENGAIYLKNSSGTIILQSYANDLSLDKFKETLTLFTCYFPIVRTLDKKTGQYRYDVELKFPGFSTCKEIDDEPCGCVEKIATPESDCYIAWKSSCSFTTCAEAMRIFAYAHFLLGKFENYQPVLDCSCNTFGIAINFNVQETENRINTANQNRIKTGHQIAFNPQCYDSSQMVCEAVERSIKLTNAEGLHVAEHILLRPHSPDDCGCRENLFCGESNRHCNYKWIIDHSDPCTEENDICFIPGGDPYSFIATVVLPAWPKRFRTVSGRLLMEEMLYRLAPAHVLLRIIWLAPHDFCCFEGKYKNWHRWLSGQQTCLSDFSVCNFLDFLFQRNYEQLEDCETCLPCKNDQENITPCFAEESMADKKDPNWFLNQVNSTFCWRTTDKYKYEFINCNQQLMNYQDKHLAIKHQEKPLTVKHQDKKLAIKHQDKQLAVKQSRVANSKEKTTGQLITKPVKKTMKAKSSAKTKK